MEGGEGEKNSLQGEREGGRNHRGLLLLGHARWRGERGPYPAGWLPGRWCGNVGTRDGDSQGLVLVLEGVLQRDQAGSGMQLPSPRVWGGDVSRVCHLGATSTPWSAVFWAPQH